MRGCQGKYCPLIHKKCIEDRCAFYQDLVFSEGEKMEVRWNCTLNWHLTMQIETAKETRHASVSTDQMRNTFDLRSGQALLRMISQMNQENGNASDNQPRLRDGRPGNETSSDG